MVTAAHRIDGVLSSLAIKAPCDAVAIANITLSGEQTVNGVAVVTNDRVLVTAQTSSVDNGVYDVKTTVWARSPDMDGNRDLVDGTLVTVKTTTGQKFFYQVDATDPIVIGTSAITFLLISGFETLNGTPQVLTGAGAVNLTTEITHIVTTGVNALTLADGVGAQKKFIVMKTDGGDGTLTPTNLGNGSTITFDDVGDSAYLVFTNSAWHFMGGTATLA